MSVLATMNSTPSRPVRTMRLTALLPPPPMPTTLMRAPSRRSGSNVNRNVSAAAVCARSSLVSFSDMAIPPGVRHPRAPRTDRTRSSLNLAAVHRARSSSHLRSVTVHPSRLSPPHLPPSHLVILDTACTRLHPCTPAPLHPCTATRHPTRSSPTDEPVKHRAHVRKGARERAAAASPAAGGRSGDARTSRGRPRSRTPGSRRDR